MRDFVIGLLAISLTFQIWKSYDLRDRIFGLHTRLSQVEETMVKRDNEIVKLLQHDLMSLVESTNELSGQHLALTQLFATHVGNEAAWAKKQLGRHTPPANVKTITTPDQACAVGDFAFSTDRDAFYECVGDGKRATAGRWTKADLTFKVTQ